MEFVVKTKQKNERKRISIEIVCGCSIEIIPDKADEVPMIVVHDPCDYHFDYEPPRFLTLGE